METHIAGTKLFHRGLYKYLAADKEPALQKGGFVWRV